MAAAAPPRRILTNSPGGDYYWVVRIIRCILNENSSTYISFEDKCTVHIKFSPFNFAVHFCSVLRIDCLLPHIVKSSQRTADTILMVVFSTHPEFSLSDHHLLHLLFRRENM